VKDLQLRSFCLSVTNETSVAEIKLYIERHTGLPPPTQRLLFSAKELIDEKKLRTTKFKKGVSSTYHYA